MAETAKILSPEKLVLLPAEKAGCSLAESITAEDVRNEYRSIYETFPDNLNAPELAFLIFRTRSGIAPWAQQMLPAGNVVLCPYLDLDHIYELFSYVPSEKYKILLQKACLKKFWPEFYQ